MSTRCAIGILNADNSVDAVYCHYDGYPEGVGRTLMTNYKGDVDAVEHMIQLGDMSHLEAKLDPEEGQEHSFEKPAENVTVFYGRDRGEKGTEAKHYKSITDFIRNLNSDFDASYAYIMTANGWFMYHLGEDNLEPLSDILGEEYLAEEPLLNGKTEDEITDPKEKLFFKNEAYDDEPGIMLESYIRK